MLELELKPRDLALGSMPLCTTPKAESEMVKDKVTLA